LAFRDDEERLAAQKQGLQRGCAAANTAARVGRASFCIIFTKAPGLSLRRFLFARMELPKR